MSALDAEQAEGDDGLTLFHFDVFRTGSTAGALEVAYQVAGTGLHSADAVDFGGAMPNGTVHFDDGQAKASITLAVIGDVALEYNESFALKIGVAEADKANVLIAAPSAGATIMNDDGDLPGLLAVRAVTGTASEGNSGITVFSFEVVRSESTLAEARVDYIVQGIGDHPTTGDDFADGIYPGGTLIFMPGETRQSIILNIAGDTAIEPDEDFTVMLVNPVNVTLNVTMAGGAIVNDDVPPPPELSIAALDAVKAEGDLGTTGFTFKVTRTGDLSGETSVLFGVSGTVDGLDFAGGALPSGTLMFAPGSGEQLLSLQIAGDTLVEPHEVFTLTLTEPVNGNLVINTAQGIIRNDDHFSIHIGDAPVRPPKSDAGAWERSWSNSHVVISHKANLTDANEAYSNVLFASSGSGVLNGGDISGGDLGVSGQTLATSAVKQEIDGTEGLRFSLDQEATGISFSLSRFFANDDGTGLNEAGRVQFFNLDQEIVKDVQFYASNAGGEKQMNIDVSEGFVEALFSAGASDGQNFVFGAYGNAAGNGYGEAPGAGHGSDYLVDAVTFEFGEVAVIGSILPNNPIDPFTI